MGASLLFLPGTGWQDRLIRAVESARPAGAPLPLATHVGLLFEGRTVVEAVPPWVRRRAYDPGEPGRVVPLALTDAQGRALWGAALDALGAWYDLPGLACAGWYALTGRPWRFYGSRAARLFCSELVVRCLRAADLDCLGMLPAEDCTPSAVEAWALRYTEGHAHGGRI